MELLGFAGLLAIAGSVVWLARVIEKMHGQTQDALAAIAQALRPVQVGMRQVTGDTLEPEDTQAHSESNAPWSYLAPGETRRELDARATEFETSLIGH